MQIQCFSNIFHQSLIFFSSEPGQKAKHLAKSEQMATLRKTCFYWLRANQQTKTWAHNINQSNHGWYIRWPFQLPTSTGDIMVGFFNSSVFFSTKLEPIKLLLKLALTGVKPTPGNIRRKSIKGIFVLKMSEFVLYL